MRLRRPPNLSTRASRHAHQTLDNPSPLNNHSDPTPPYLLHYTLAGAACTWVLVQLSIFLHVNTYLFSLSLSSLSLSLFIFCCAYPFFSPSLGGRIGSCCPVSLFASVCVSSATNPNYNYNYNYNNYIQPTYVLHLVHKKPRPVHTAYLPTYITVSRLVPACCMPASLPSSHSIDNGATQRNAKKGLADALHDYPRF
ncbi:hypothetical protein F4809DRAFT_138821 [Biscogniauxia mediterranea]|nr:hypothetical protein F4809DRAFT_138821 [Biscogniauxia mediterranea]